VFPEKRKGQADEELLGPFRSLNVNKYVPINPAPKAIVS